MDHELLLNGGLDVTVDVSLEALSDADLLVRDVVIIAVAPGLSNSGPDADAGITTIADWAHNLRSAEYAGANLRELQESHIRGYFLYGSPGPKSDSPNPSLDTRRMRGEHFPNGVSGRLPMRMALRGSCFTSAEQNAEEFKFARNLGSRFQHTSAWRKPRMRSLCSTGSTCQTPTSIC